MFLIGKNNEYNTCEPPTDSKRKPGYKYAVLLLFLILYIYIMYCLSKMLFNLQSVTYEEIGICNKFIAFFNFYFITLSSYLILYCNKY